MTKETFAREVEGHMNSMYCIAYTILRNDHDVQDALQEAALKAWEKRQTLRQEAYFATWMTRILINECHSLCRKRKRVAYLSDLPETGETPQGITLRLLIEGLPEKLRLPFMMKYAEGMNAEEIAYALKITRPAVNSRIHRAKETIRKELNWDDGNL